MSMNIVEIDERLSSVEAALTQVQQKLGLVPASGDWVEQISGSLADIPEDEYQQFLDCCRTVRTGGSNEEPRP